jgi:hypothetical protein
MRISVREDLEKQKLKVVNNFNFHSMDGWVLVYPGIWKFNFTDWGKTRIREGSPKVPILKD